MNEMKKENGVKEKYLKEIYLNVLKAIIIVLYFFVLNLTYENVSREHLVVGIKVFSMIFLFISIYIFEKAYKKDDEKLAVQGIEILILSAYTLTTEHIVNKFKFEFKSYSLVTSYIFAIYYILRCIIIYTKGRNEVAKEFSDIREIVQKKEPTKKEATKKVKKETETEEKTHEGNRTKNRKTKIEKNENNEMTVNKKKKRPTQSKRTSKVTNSTNTKSKTEKETENKIEKKTVKKSDSANMNSKYRIEREE